MGNGEHQVAWPNATGPQRQLQGIGSVTHTDGMAHPNVGGKRLFKGLHLSSQDVPATLKHPMNSGVNFSLMGQVACLGIGLWHCNRSVLAHR